MWNGRSRKNDAPHPPTPPSSREEDSDPATARIKPKKLLPTQKTKSRSSRACIRRTTLDQTTQHQTRQGVWWAVERTTLKRQVTEAHYNHAKLRLCVTKHLGIIPSFDWFKQPRGTTCLWEQRAKTYQKQTQQSAKPSAKKRKHAVCLLHPPLPPP